MRRNFVILFIFIGLFLFVLGGGLGILYEAQQNGPQTGKSQTEANNLVRDLSSEVVRSIVVYGKVEAIDGKNIIVSNGGDIITIELSENIQAYSSSRDDLGRPSQQEIQIKDIKKGDILNITSKLLPDGQLQGLSVFIAQSSL